jgi:uncharacterized protein (DUF885 family)
MGEVEYDWALTNNFHLATTAARLYEESWPIVETNAPGDVQARARHRQTACATVPSDGYAAVSRCVRRTRKDYPKSDTEMVGPRYREAAVRLVDVRPDNRHVRRIRPTTSSTSRRPRPPLEASIDGAAYYPAPPFKNSGVGRFFTDTDAQRSCGTHGQQQGGPADLSAHEGFPGHDWYFKVLTQHRDQVSPVRWLTPGLLRIHPRMWQDSMPAEGWGLYAETR